MGGDLLKLWGLPEKRCSTKEFVDLVVEISSVLRTRFPMERIESIRYFSEKQNHGDIDLLLESFGGSIDYKKEFGKLFFQEVHVNGMVYSFPFRGIQIDIIVIHENKFDIAYNYYNYENGMLVGVIARSLGLIHAHDGLHLNLPLSVLDPSYVDHQFHTFLISRDPETIFKILGFDYNVFQSGFKNKEELYNWVINSHHFRPEKYLYENLTHENRKRNKLRITYRGFLDYLKRFSQEAKPIPTKEHFRTYILNQFNHLVSEIDNYKLKLAKDRERAAKFNGQIIMDLLGFSGTALGNFIRSFKDEKAKTAGTFEEYVDSRAANDILEDIKSFYAL